MGSIVAEEDLPFVIKKIWCHGQSVLPPIIGIASLSYAIRENNCASGVWLGCVVPLVLCAWPFLSWKAVVEATNGSVATTSSTLLHESSTIVGGTLPKNPSRRLWWGGIAVLLVYLSILFSVMKHCENNNGNQHLTGLGLLLSLFSGLAAIETMAFLAVVATCIRNNRRSYNV